MGIYFSKINISLSDVALNAISGFDVWKSIVILEKAKNTLMIQKNNAKATSL